MALERRPPSPPVRPGILPRLLGHLVDFRRDPPGFYVGLARDLGDVVALRFGPLRAYLVSSPPLIRRVLLENSSNYSKRTPAYSQLRAVVGQGLLTSDGEPWRRQRRIAQPAFHGDRIRRFSAVMRDAALETARAWDAACARDPGLEIDAQAEMSDVTLKVVIRTLLGSDQTREAHAVRESLGVVLESLDHRLTHPLSGASWLPTRRNRAFNLALKRLRQSVDRIIEVRQAEPESPDLLSMLMSARDEETGQAMSPAQLRDEVMTILLAGHETTAAALSWAWHLLAAHPEAEARLHAELDAALGGRAPSFEDLPRLPYTRMVFLEALRLFPPFWSIGRRAEKSDRLGDHEIPEGSLVIVSPYAVHRNPRLWRDPERFDPERFRPGSEEQSEKYAYLPFGGGMRSCIGNHFAMMEGQIILACLAQRFRLSPKGGAGVFQPGFKPAPVLSLRPPAGHPLRVLRRKG